MPPLLHEDNLRRIPFTGKHLQRRLQRRITEVKRAFGSSKPPNVSIVIRTRNDMAYLPSLLADISAQDYTGKVEIILVDTESTDGTAEYARQSGATVISLAQADFTYPRSLNLGFAAARHPYVVSLVGHSNLANRYMLHSLTQWHTIPNLGGIYCYPLPNWNASKTERLGWIFNGGKWLGEARLMSDMEMGMLGANCSILRKSAWQALGGYDEAFAGGGEDGALAAKMLANGYTIMRDPLVSVYHSHHLGPINGYRQLMHWREITKPTDFNADSILSRRPDLRR